MVYYPVPLHRQEAYRSFGFDAKNFRVSEELSQRVISLPMHTELDDEQQAYIIEQVLSYF